MPILLSSLSQVAPQAGFVKVAESLTEALKQSKRTAFLSHSSKDKDYAKGLQVKLKQAGWDVYLYWEDNGLDSSPGRSTADRVRRIIILCDFFIFLATPNSMTSRWCPWEIGYADGKKVSERILIIPTTDQSGRFYGNEYLHLYRRIDLSDAGDYAVFDPNETRGVYLKSI